MRFWLNIALAASVALCGCKRESRHFLDRVDLAGSSVLDNAILAWTPAQVQALLVEKLAAQGSFVVLKAGQRAPEHVSPVRLALELAFTREAQAPGRPGSYAEVGAALSLRCRAAEGSTRYDVFGLGEARISGDSLDERQEAMRRALGLALENAVASAHLQLAALEKSDGELVKDLNAGDARVRELAVWVLSDRKNPVVVPALLERLKGSEPDEVRRAIGGLVEMRDARAVPLMIELSRGQDPAFLKELIFALGAIGDEEAEAYLFTVAEGHDQRAIREAAQQALDEIHNRAREREVRREPSARNVPGGDAE